MVRSGEQEPEPRPFCNIVNEGEPEQRQFAGNIVNDADEGAIGGILNELEQPTPDEQL